MIKDIDEKYSKSTQELILELFMDTDEILKKNQISDKRVNASNE